MDRQIVKRKEAVEDGNPGCSSKRVCGQNREGGESDVRWAAYTLMGWGRGSGLWETDKGKEIVKVDEEYIDLEDEYEDDGCEDDDYNEDEKAGYEGDVDITDNEVEEEEMAKGDSPLLKSDFERKKFWELVWRIPLSDFVGDEANNMNQAMVVYVAPANQKDGGGSEAFPAVLYFMCAVRKAMLALVQSPENNYQGMQASFSLLDIREKMINLNLSDQPILGSAADPIHYRLDTAIKGALSVLSLKPVGRARGKWVPLTSLDDSSGRWRWVGPKPNPSDPQHEIMDVEKAHTVWGVSKIMLYNLTISFKDWLETEDRHMAALATVQTGSAAVTAHDLVGFLIRLRVERGRMFRVPNPSFSAARARFQEEERIRYTVPSRAFFYTALDGGKSTVSPAYSSKWTVGKRRSIQLSADCPAGVTVLSIVKDAASRLPGGEGTTRDVCVLARDSQYLTEPAMVDAKFRMMVSSALNRLRWERDPSVVFAKVPGKRGMWRYLHRMRGVDDFREDGRQVVARDSKLNDAVLSGMSTLQL